MKNHIAKIVQCTLIFGLSLALIECGSSNRLREYDFRDFTAAAVVSAPPGPEVFTNSFIFLDKDDPIGSALRLGTTIAKEVQAGKAQARLDSAMQQVDIPERIRGRVLQRSSTYLHYDPTDDYRDSDFLFDIYIREYGIDAKSWDSRVYFKIDVKVHLIDNGTGMEIWEAHVEERKPLSQSIFGWSGSPTDNIITAVALSSLSVKEMAIGFQNLADYTADRVAQKLQEDFEKSRYDG